MLVLITEKEAKTRLCPFAMGKIDGKQFGACVASECMAWRIDRPTKERETLVCDENGKPVGYCGIPHI